MSVPDLLDAECEECGAYHTRLICGKCFDERQATRDAWILEKIEKIEDYLNSGEARKEAFPLSCVCFKLEELKKLLGGGK